MLRCMRSWTRCRVTYAQMAVDEQLGRQLTLVALFKKGAQEREFAVPQQGYYSGKLSNDLSVAWKILTDPETVSGAAPATVGSSDAEPADAPCPRLAETLLQQPSRSPVHR